MQIAALDYDVITEINIPEGTHRLISYDKQIKDTIVREGVFQEEIRRIADRFMDG